MNVRTWCGLLAVVTVLVPIGGCRWTSQERIEAAQTALATARQASAGIEVQIADWSAQLAAAEKMLADPNLPPAELLRVRGWLTQARAVLGELQDKKTLVDRTLARLQEIIDAGPQANAQLQDELQLLAQGLLAGSAVLPAPVGMWVKLAGLLVGLLATFFGARAPVVGKLRSTQTALTEVVAGGEQFKTQVGPDAATVGQWKDAMRAAQSPTTARIVAVTKADVKADQAFKS